MVELLEAVGKGGPLVLCALILVGIFILAIRLVPPVIDLRTEVRLLRETVIARADAHDKKDDGIIAAMDRVASRQSEIATDVAEGVAEAKGIAQGAALATGQHAAVSAERPPPPEESRKQRR